MNYLKWTLRQLQHVLGANCDGINQWFSDSRISFKPSGYIPLAVLICQLEGPRVEMIVVVKLLAGVSNVIIQCSDRSSRRNKKTETSSTPIYIGGLCYRSQVLRIQMIYLLQ